MDAKFGERGGVGRRNFLQIAAGGVGLAAVGSAALAAPSEDSPDVVRQPAPDFGADWNTADIIVETLLAWGATHAFGIVGDGINTIIEALRKRQDRIQYIGVRHEEAAAFMASGFAKHTGRLGVCVGTTGPGAVHLLNWALRRAHGRRPRGRAHRLDVPRPARDAIPAGHRHDETDGARRALQRGGDRPAARHRGRESRLSRGAGRPRRRASDRRQGRADDEAFGRQALDGEPRRADVFVLDAGARATRAQRAEGGGGSAELGAQGRDTGRPGRAERTRRGRARRRYAGAPVAKALLGKAVLPDNSPFTQKTRRSPREG